MSDRRISIRIGMEGGAEVQRGLEDISRAGTDGFDRMAKSWGYAGDAATKYKAQLAGIAAAAKEAANADEVNASWSRFLGVNDSVSKSARDSAAAFEQNGRTLGDLRGQMELHLGSLGRAFTAWRLLNYGMESVRATAALTDDQLAKLGINDFDVKTLDRVKNLQQGWTAFSTRLQYDIAEAIAGSSRLFVPGVSQETVDLAKQKGLLGPKPGTWADWVPSRHPGPIDFNRRLDIAAAAKEDALLTNALFDKQVRESSITVTPGLMVPGSGRFGDEFAMLKRSIAADSRAPIEESQAGAQTDFARHLQDQLTTAGRDTGKSVEEQLKGFNEINKAAEDRLKASKQQQDYEDAIFGRLQDEVTAARQGHDERERTLAVTQLQWQVGQKLTEGERAHVAMLVEARQEAQRMGALQDQMAGSFASWLKDVETTGKISFKSLFGSILSDWENMLNKMIAENILKTLFSGLGGSGGSVLSSLFASVFHEGGIVGEDGTPRRVVSPAMFAGAPRFHSGLAWDEFPAILQKGERVIPKSQAKGSNAATPTTIELIVTVTPSPLFGVAMQTIKVQAVNESVNAVRLRVRNGGGRL